MYKPLKMAVTGEGGIVVNVLIWNGGIFKQAVPTSAAVSFFDPRINKLNQNVTECIGH
jgi:hypothetical protein